MINPLELIKLIQSFFDPKMLYPEYRKNWTESNPTYGFCYIASEALYHLYGKYNHYIPTQAKDDKGVSHWWLECTLSKYLTAILDPTREQYISVGRHPPYLTGKQRHFLTNQPSKRSQILINKVEEVLMENAHVERLEWAIATPWLIKKHYAKRTPTGRAYGLYIDNILKGVCVYSSVIPNVAASVCGEEYAEYVKELSRLVVIDGLPENTLSWFVGQTFKLIAKPKIIMSYSDRNQHHTGYIYQALNFCYTGRGGDSREFIFRGQQVSTRPEGLRRIMKMMDGYDSSITIAENVIALGGEVIDLKQKNRYIHFLGSKTKKKQMRRALRFEVLPYPKEENERYSTDTKLGGTQIQII